MRAPTSGRVSLIVGSLLVCLVAVSLVACARNERQRSDAIGSSTAVTFDAGGVELAGRLFGSEDATAGVVLAHMLPADQSAWYRTADRLADLGYRVLTFDFRGFCPGGDAGCSEGDLDVDAAPTDLAAALTYLRSQGVTSAALVGASMGGTAALVVSADEGDGVGAVDHALRSAGDPGSVGRTGRPRDDHGARSSSSHPRATPRPPKLRRRSSTRACSRSGSRS